jgi:hypothetical protein
MLLLSLYDLPHVGVAMATAHENQRWHTEITAGNQLEINASTRPLPVAEARRLRTLRPPDLAWVLRPGSIVAASRLRARGIVEASGFGGFRRRLAADPLFAALTRHRQSLPETPGVRTKTVCSS